MPQKFQRCASGFASCLDKYLPVLKNKCIPLLYILGAIMEASILDLRYRMRDGVKALDKREKVRIFHRGKLKGEILPAQSTHSVKTVDHPFFGSLRDENSESASAIVAKMRRRRCNAL
jgi:hypothetical protein